MKLLGPCLTVTYAILGLAALMTAWRTRHVTETRLWREKKYLCSSKFLSLFCSFFDEAKPRFFSASQPQALRPESMRKVSGPHSVPGCCDCCVCHTDGLAIQRLISTFLTSQFTCLRDIGSTGLSVSRLLGGHRRSEPQQKYQHVCLSFRMYINACVEIFFQPTVLSQRNILIHP